MTVFMDDRVPPAPPDFYEALLHERPCVSEEGENLALHFRQGERQSLMSVQHPNQLELPYTKTMMGFMLMRPNPASILMIGLGGGSMAKFCYVHLPRTRITVVEINPHVIELRSRFQVPADDARFSVVCADGAHFVHETDNPFDVMLVDGFDPHGQPEQLCSQAFYDNCRHVLDPQGIMVVNLDGDHPAHASHLQRIQKTFGGHCVTVAVPDRSNHIVFAMKDAAMSAAGSGALHQLSQSPPPPASALPPSSHEPASLMPKSAPPISGLLLAMGW